MARPKKYDAVSLRRAVDKYFRSITRKVMVTEKVDTGRKDSSGHIIWETKPVTNQMGKELWVTEYLVPPTVAGLCEFLGIHRSTWAEYCDPEQHPEFSDTTTHARGCMQGWREEQLIVRKDVKGIVFDLQNNYGYRERQSVEVTGGVEEFLKKQEELGKGVQQF